MWVLLAPDDETFTGCPSRDDAEDMAADLDGPYYGWTVTAYPFAH